MYKALKPLKIAGKQYNVGERIEDGAIAQGRENTLIKLGVIERAQEMGPTAAPMLDGANTRPDTKNGSQGVKQPLKPTKSAQPKKPAARKGGK